MRVCRNGYVHILNFFQLSLQRLLVRKALLRPTPKTTTCFLFSPRLLLKLGSRSELVILSPRTHMAELGQSLHTGPQLLPARLQEMSTGAIAASARWKGSTCCVADFRNFLARLGWLPPGGQPHSAWRAKASSRQMACASNTATRAPVKPCLTHGIGR